MKAFIPIVSTKLQPPIMRGPSKGRILQRQRLVDALNLVTSRRLTLVCASPGFGKTTLLATLTSFDCPVVWYSLSTTDQDLAVFISYLVEGVRLHHPGFGKRVQQLLSRQHENSLSPERIAGELVNALADIGDTDIIIVLDDYHAVDRSETIRGITDYLVSYSPVNTHLVIATRQAPRLPSLPRLRMLGEVADIDEADLRFTPDEVETLFRDTYDLRPGREVIERVTERIEGWGIALHLAAQSLIATPEGPAPESLAGLGGNRKRLFEYLAEEVFNRQPESVQRFLCDSSILSTLSALICDSVLREAGSGRMLERIEQDNLFVTQIGEGNWRYHHLFRDFLRQQLDREPGRAVDLHRRAGAHFEGNEDYVQAIQHYLAAAEYPDVVRLIGKVGQAMLRASRFDTLIFWIGQIPENDLDYAPDVLLMQAQVFELQGHYERSLDWLRRAGKSYATLKDGVGLSKVLCRRATMAAWRLGRYSEAAVLFRQALDLLSPNNAQERADVLSRVALNHMQAGDPMAGWDTYQQALGIYEDLGDREGTLATLIGPGTWIYFLRGDFQGGLSALFRALAIAEQIGNKYRQAECLGCLGVTLCYLNRHGEGRQYAQKALALSREIGAVQLETDCLIYLSQTCVGGRAPDFDAALRYNQEAVRLAEIEGYERVRIRSKINEVAILRRMGALVDANMGADMLLGIAEKTTEAWFMASAKVVAASALIGQDDARAEKLLLSARDVFLRYQDKWSITCLEFWIAALYVNSRLQKSLEHFRSSLELARVNGYDHWYLEEHSAAVPLLALAISRNVYPDYCMERLGEFGSEALDDFRALLQHEDERIRRIGEDQLQRLGIDVPGQSQDTQALIPEPGNATSDMVHSLSKNLQRQDLPCLRICCLGHFKVYVGDRLIQENEWQRRKVKSLLKYLATCRDHTATKDEVVELLWGDQTPDAARGGLRTALHLLRRALEPDSHSRFSKYVTSDQGLLSLRPEAVQSVDLDTFMRHVAAGQRAEQLGDLELARIEYEHLTTGEFLTDDPYEEWTIPRRERVRRLFHSAQEKLARWRMDGGEHEVAVAHLQRILADDPAREDVHVLLMRCLSRSGRRREALAQYTVCRRALREELDFEPAPETQGVYDSLLSGQAI